MIKFSQENDHILKLFLNGEIICKINGEKIDNGVIRQCCLPFDYTTLMEDMEKKYHCLLKYVNTYIQIAYTYDCLTLHPKTKKCENFNVLYKQKFAQDWTLWFKIIS
jgi:hypothetical protein